MLSRPQVMSADEANIITTWEIPFQKIVSRASMDHRDAVDLMHIFAFMHHETIPERVFQRSWADLRIAQSSLKSCPDVLQPVWTERAQARFRSAIGILCDHSIIEYEPKQGLCTMHPVVHNWARARLSDIEQISWLRCTTAILAQCVSPYLEASGRRFRALLLPHINSCLQFQRSCSAQDSETLITATELERFAWVYAEQGQWKSARQLQDRVVRMRKKLLGRRHRDTIRAQNSLGQTLWNLFEFKPAGEIQREILNALRWRRPTFGDWIIWPVWLPTHTSYCLALSEVTSILWLAGERSLSKWTGERAVAGLTQRLGPKDPLTLKAMFHLARTYMHLGEGEKCHQLLLWVLKYQKRFFGMNHPDTLMTRNELGMLLCASKRHLPAAQRLVENVLQARRQILGEEHAYTLWSINDLSKIYIEVGRADDAVTILENIVPIVVRTLGQNHVGMSMTRTNLGRAYFMSERWAEAEDTVRPLLAEIPPNHPDWIHTMYGYAQILFELGRLEDAEKHCNQAMDKISKAKTFSLDHPRTVSVAVLLIKIYNLQGRESDSVAIRRKIPHVGVAEVQIQFDPYAVRRASAQSSRAAASTAAVRARNDSLLRDSHSPQSSAQDRVQRFNLVSRRTL
jgi:tetratricopeptide (TPR) repeat protein